MNGYMYMFSEITPKYTKTLLKTAWKFDVGKIITEKVSGESKWSSLPLIMLNRCSNWPDSHASLNSWIGLVGSERLQHFAHSCHQTTEVNNSLQRLIMVHMLLCSSQCILVLCVTIPSTWPQCIQKTPFERMSMSCS